MSESTPTPTDSLHIGQWRLDASTHRLHGNGQEKRLTRLQVQLLLALAERPAQSWSRQELIARVWPRRMVADEVLSRAIAQLRVLLEDDARNPTHIETLHGTGYRLLAEVGPAPPMAETPPCGADISTGTGLGPPGMPARRAPRLLVASVAVACMSLAAYGLWRKPPPEAPPAWSHRIAAAQSYMSTGEALLQPRFASDGQRLLWIQPAQRRLQIADRNGRVLHQIELAPEQAGSAVFSPDGQSVYALLQNESCRLVEIPLPPRGAPIELSACLHASLGLSVEADGSVLFTGAARGLLRHRPDGSPAQVLTSPDCEACTDSQPRVAGANIAFLRGRSGRQAVWLRQPTGETTPLSGGDDQITDLSYDARHSALLAASNAYGSPALIEIDLATAESRLLGARGAYALDIAIDGALVFEQRRVQSPLWLRTVDGGLRPLTQSLRDDSQPALSPDGRRVAFVSNRSGSGSVWLLDLDRGEEAALSLPPARAWTRPSWSPDGHRLWLSRYDDTGVHAVQIDVATGRARPLPRKLTARMPERVIEVAQGEWLLISLREGARVLAHQRGAIRTELADSRGIATLAQEGEWVVFSRNDHPQLWAWRLDRPDRTPHPLHLPQSNPWTLRQGALWHYDPDAQGRILRTSLIDGDTQVWADDFGSAPRDLQVMEDGRALLFSRVQRVDSELMLAAPQD